MATIKSYTDELWKDVVGWVVGRYDVKARKWVEKYENFDKYVIE